MKKIILILIVNLFIISLTHAQEYAVSKINSELLKNSNAIVRLCNEEFTVISRKEAKYKVKGAITLLNEQAPEQFGGLFLGYSKFSKVDKIKATIYDANGVQVLKLKQSDVIDRSSASSSVDDIRYKVYDPSYKKYPFTIEYEYQYNYDGSLFYPEWDPQGEDGVAIENALFKVFTPTNMSFRHKNVNVSKPDTAIVENQKTYTWKLNNLPSLEEEAYSPNLNYLLPRVLTAPIDFELDGHVGNMNSWDNFAKWIIELNKGRDQLDAKTEADLKNLILASDDDVTKVRKVYQYLQTKTRYVSIQLGIGGWQPFPAREVGEKGYGDCKALTNYTMAMLKRIGIKSHYTLVRAGRDALNVDRSFPSSQFNHAFLCVPLKKDTIWLECTSQTNPFGFTGTFTGDRNVLLITEEGGKIVRTPCLTKEDNSQLRKAIVNLSDAGDASIKIATNFRGLQFENGYINHLVYESKEDQKKYLYESLSLSNFTIDNFSYDIINEIIPTAVEKLDISVRGFTAKNGKRMFFQPNLLNKLQMNMPNYESRRSDIVWDFPYTDIDSIEYNLSAKYFVEYLPPGTNIKSEFGEYKAEFLPSDGKLIYIRKFTINKGAYPKEKYKEFSDFIKKVKLADNIKLAIVDKT